MDLPHRLRISFSIAIPLGLVVLLGCDAAQTVDPQLDASARFHVKRHDLNGAALFVGNLNFGPEDAILRYDGRGAFINAFIPEGTAGLSGPCCMVFGPDENLYVPNPFGGNVLRFHGVTGEFIDEFIPAGSGGLVLPLVMIFRKGKLYVGDPGSNAIRRYDAETGAFIDVFVPPGSQGMAIFDPQHFDFGPDGNLYVAAQFTNRVLRYDGRTGAFIDVFASGGAPSGLTFGPDGHLYVGTLDEVRRYDIGTSALIDVFVPSGSGGLSSPVGIVFGPDGNLYAASAGSSQILRYSGRSGQFIDVFVPAGSGGITGPRMLAFKSTMTLCHRSPGHRSKGKTITVRYLASFDHVAHGDALGACAKRRR